MSIRENKRLFPPRPVDFRHGPVYKVRKQKRLHNQFITEAMSKTIKYN